jgi:hypothetical protein
VRALREAYQILKQKYQEKGDNATVGDFHFGEMEMTRREYGWLIRLFGLEAWYGWLSGYGRNPRRATVVLLFLMFGFTGLYMISANPTLQGNFLESLLLSIQASTLQPISLDRFNASLRLVIALERIVVPVQIALLALALRMRLKR